MGFGFMSRIKDLFGAPGQRSGTTVAAATSVYVPDDMAWVPLTGSATITELLADVSSRRRIVFFIQSDSGSTVFTNTDGATTAGTMDLGGSDITLGQTDVLCLRLHIDGTWVRVFNTNN